jgi:hypothetical protein
MLQYMIRVACRNALIPACNFACGALRVKNLEPVYYRSNYGVIHFRTLSSRTTYV